MMALLKSWKKVKKFFIDYNGRKCTVSLDMIKPTFLASDNSVTIDWLPPKVSSKDPPCYSAGTNYTFLGTIKGLMKDNIVGRGGGSVWLNE